MSLAIDIRHAVRRINRRPGQAIVAIITLAIGLAVSAALFTVTRDIVFRPFPFRDQNRLAAIWASDIPHGVPHLELTYFEFDELQKHAKSFDGVALISAANFNVVADTPEPHQINANIVSASFPRLLGMNTLRGRTFVDAD